MPSLYRKWRSRSFDDLVGQEHVVRTLRNAVAKQRVAHAYLFTGPRGTGKTSTARILAKAVNCLQPRDGNPCDQCETCRAASEGRAFDVIEIDAASNTSVENVRDLRERVAYAASEGRYKVYIVDEVHRLSGAAFDAFLKTLEEPPPHVIFVFASTEPHKVPETITSRCQRFDFRRIPGEEMLERLRYVAGEEQLEVADDALRIVVLHSGGSLRDALGLLDQVASYTTGEITDREVRSALGLADAGLVADLTEFLLKGETARGLAAFGRFVDEGGDPRQLLRQFVEYLRALLLRVSGVPLDEVSVDPALAGHLPAHARDLRESQVVALLRAMTEQEFSARFNVPIELPFEVAYVQASLSLRPATGLRPVDPAPVQNSSSQPVRTPPPIEVQKPEATPIAADPPAIPTPVPSAAEPAPAPLPSRSDSVSGDVESMWLAIVAGMRSRSAMLQAVLRSAHLMKAVEGEITIGFLHPFHVSQVTDTKKRKLLEEVVSEVLGRHYRVNCVLTTREEIEAIRGADALQNDDGFIEELTERLRDFHARQIQNGHS